MKRDKHKKMKQQWADFQTGMETVGRKYLVFKMCSQQCKEPSVFCHLHA